MKKLLLILGLLLLSSLAIAEIVALVDQVGISSEQLYEEIKNLDMDDFYSFQEIKKRALNKLITEQLLLNYAAENGIMIDNLELESYFIQELGSMPRFRTNDEFDYYKFGRFKNSETGVKILSGMNRELLLNKTKILIKKKFELPDDKLMEEFIMENTEIGLNYAIFNINNIAVPTFLDVTGADQFYHENQREYHYLDKAKFSFYFYPFSDYTKQAETKSGDYIKELILADSTISLSQIDALSAKYIKAETKNIAFNNVSEAIGYLKAGYEIPTRKYSTPYLTKEDEFGIFTKYVLKLGFALQRDEISEPILLDTGYLIVVQEKKIREKRDDLPDIAPQIWKDYITNYRENSLKGGMEEYFSRHFDEFVGAAAYANIITIPSHKYGLIPQRDEEKIKLELEETFGDEKRLAEIVRNYNLRYDKKIIYLEKYSNDSEIIDLVKDSVLKEENSGFIRYNDDLIYFFTNTFFPEFIPGMDKIRETLISRFAESIIDTTGFYEFYRERKTDFFTLDSLQIGGVFIPINPDSVQIDDNAIITHYNSNLDDFKREKSVEFSCFHIRNYALLNLVQDCLDNDVSWQELRQVYGDSVQLPEDEIVVYDDLPITTKKELLLLNETEISDFTEYKTGWISYYKIKDYSAGIIDFYEAKNEIITKLKYQFADAIARAEAKAIFDSTSLFGSVYKYAPDEFIFKSPLQPADEPFEKISDLGNNRAEMMRKWRNEKLNKIVETDDGYAVVFQLKKSSAKQQNFEDVIPVIGKIFEADEKLEAAREYSLFIQDQIKQGANADSLLFYLGGWNNAENLTLESKLFGNGLSRLILEDITRHSEGYFSNIIKISENQLMFYHIQHLKKIHPEAFYKEKSRYKEKNIDRKFINWLNVLRENSEIIIK